MSAGEASCSGKTVVVIGGSGGIGAASAARFAGQGATVVLGYRSKPDQARAALDSLPGEGHQAIQVDIMDTQSIVAMRDAVKERFGTVDILVNSAGTTTPVAHGDLDALTDEIIDEVFASNWRGVFATIRAFAPLLREAGEAVILNVSSIAAFKGVGSSVAYCGAKAGLDAMTHTLALALAPQIRVLSISPGVVDTGFVPGRTKEQIAKMSAAAPLGAIVTARDVAEAIYAAAVHLPRSTGIRLVVDSGRSL